MKDVVLIAVLAMSWTACRSPTAAKPDDAEIKASTVGGIVSWDESAGIDLNTITLTPEVEAPLVSLCEKKGGDTAALKKTFSDLMVQAVYLAKKLDRSDCKMVAKGLSIVETVNTQSTDVSIAALLPRLRSLDVSGEAWPTGFSRFAGGSLETVVITWNGTMAPPPETLQTFTTDLAKIPQLTGLIFSRAHLKTGDFLAALPRLQMLALDSNELADVEFARNMSALRELSLSGNAIKSLEPLSDCLDLEILDARSNRIVDISPLLNLTNLERVSLGQNPKIDSLLALRHLPNLHFLDVSTANIGDLAALSEIASLEYLDMRGNHVKDLTPLAGLGIHQLFASNNAISDLAALESMTKLQRLVIDSNPIKIFPRLPEHMALRVVSIANTQITNLCRLRLIPNLEALRTPGGGQLDRNKIKALPVNCN